MEVKLRPTREMFNVPANGANVPTRIWMGETQAGVGIEAYILSIVPVRGEDVSRLQEELPGFMRPTREVMRIDTERAKEANPEPLSMMQANAKFIELFVGYGVWHSLGRHGGSIRLELEGILDAKQLRAAADILDRITAESLR
jgi:hypothetical protein